MLPNARTYLNGPSGKGRSRAGFANSTGCSSVWGSTYPFNPYPFPWTNHLFQDCTSMAMGIFEGHMAKMAEGFRAIRSADLPGRIDAVTPEAADPASHGVHTVLLTPAAPTRTRTSPSAGSGTGRSSRHRRFSGPPCPVRVTPRMVAGSAGRGTTN